MDILKARCENVSTVEKTNTFTQNLYYVCDAKKVHLIENHSTTLFVTVSAVGKEKNEGKEMTLVENEVEGE